MLVKKLITKKYSSEFSHYPSTKGKDINFTHHCLRILKKSNKNPIVTISNITPITIRFQPKDKQGVDTSALISDGCKEKKTAVRITVDSLNFLGSAVRRGSKIKKT
jgi:hypothetical protein